MITGAVVLDLSRVGADPDRHDRHLLDALNRVPDGAHVIVDIGARQYVTRDAAVWLHEHEHRLSIEIRGTDPEAIPRFIRAARDGEWRLA